MSKWLEIGFEIPFVGPFLKLIVVVVPPFIGIGILAMITNGLSWGWSVLLIGILSLLWLRFLEKRTGLRMVVPPINLPWVWICWAIIGYGVLVILGIME